MSDTDVPGGFHWAKVTLFVSVLVLIGVVVWALVTKCSGVGGDGDKAMKGDDTNTESAVVEPYVAALRDVDPATFVHKALKPSWKEKSVVV